MSRPLASLAVPSIVALLTASCATTSVRTIGDVRFWKKNPTHCTALVAEWVRAKPGQDLDDAVRDRAGELHASDVHTGKPTSELSGEAGGGAIAGVGIAGGLASTSTKETWSVYASFYRCQKEDLTP